MSDIGICQTEETAQGLSPSLADKAPVVLRRYFDSTTTFLTHHHIAGYESAIFREIPTIIASENPIVVLKEPLDAEKGIYKYKTEIFVGGDSPAVEDLAIDVGPPVITLNGGKTVRRMFPNEARLRNLTYAAQFRADILIRLTFTNIVNGEMVSQIRELRTDGFPLFRIPILLRSKLCATHGAGVEMLREMGECPADQGGYFIIDGAEKVLITRQEQALNSVFVSKKPENDPKIYTYATVVCQSPTTRRSNRVAFYRLKGTRRGIEDGAIRVSIPFVKGAIPLFVLFRALGVETDEEIVRMILPTEDQAAEDTLISCIHDAWPITTQPLAIEFIRTLTKGFLVAHVLDILHNHLFSHVIDRPLAKAQYCAEIIRKMIRVERGSEPSTNRDDIRNQRLLPTGTLLRGLFGECWKLWKKAVIHAVDIQYNYNRQTYQDENFLELFVPANLPRILSTNTLNDAIIKGFRGKWGTNQFNMKTGVIQPLARISYLDAASHTRRVVSDFDTSLKIVGPRQLHTSQVGYFCTSETPTGAHIGATKNLSILTAISVDIPAEPVVQWLLERGGVIEVAMAPRWMRESAISVQVNGGTVGFTQNPGELVHTLKLMKWTGCLSPMASIAFNTSERIVRINLDDGRPLRPLWHLKAGEWSETEHTTWRNFVLGTLPETAGFQTSSVEFLDPLANLIHPSFEDYRKKLEPYVGSIEYVDPYEGNESYIHWWGDKKSLTRDHTHAEIHPSTLMGLLASMIPFANHNQSPRNQLSCSQSKQAIGYYASNYENRFDTYGSMLCYGEGAICRTIVHDAVAGGGMPYGTNLIFAFNCFDGYNQDDGILFNRSSVERGMFRSLALRSYETVEEEDAISGAVYRIGNPKFVLAWTDLQAGNDYTQLDDQGIIREGAIIHEKTVLVGRYLMIPETGKVKDASLLPTVFTKGRVDKVVVLNQANGLRLVKVRILEERVPELGDKYCLDDSHDVLTLNRGWVSIADVSLNDKVAQLNRQSGQMEYVNPIEVLQFAHEGEMWEVENSHVSQFVTSNHRMWVRGMHESEFGFKEMRTITESVNYLVYDSILSQTNESLIKTENVKLHFFSGKVYCIRVPSEVFLVRRNGKCSYTGNSSRHGQKGTMGMLIDAADMPRTADGMVPDVMVNPHCIPSRMTMAQMLEQLFGKLGAVLGTKVNATPFMNDQQSLQMVSKALEMAGLHPMGEEILYAGTTGKMFTSSIFMGPLNFMRLKHLAQDKINARGAGRREIRTHQPTGGRGNEGGMRIGEMERDVLIAHGITDFLQESMMRRSDGTEFWVCNGCGTIPVVNEAESMFVCPLCDGPLQYQGVSADTIGLVMPVKKSRCTFSKVQIPYAAKLLDQELTTFMNAGFRFLTAKGMRRFQEPTEIAAVVEEADFEEGGDVLEAKVDEAAKVKVAATPKSIEKPVEKPVKPIEKPVEEESAETPEDREDEGQPARNESVPVVPREGQDSFDFSTKENKEFTTYYSVKLNIDGKVWPSVEHYFQAMKFPENPEYQEQIRTVKTPAAAKKLGKTDEIPTRPDWSKVRESVMVKANRVKFQIPALKAKLLETGTALLRHQSPQDNFWGVGRSGKGQNKLGRVLMQIRTELQAAKASQAVEEKPIPQGAAQQIEYESNPEVVESLEFPDVDKENEMEKEGRVIDIEFPEAPLDVHEETKPDMEFEDGSKVADFQGSDVKVIKF